MAPLLSLLSIHDAPYPHCSGLTFQATFWGMLRMFTLMPTSSPRLANLFCLCRCLPLLCYTMVLSFLLLGVGFEFSLTSFRSCLNSILHALIFFIGSFQPFKTRLGKAFCFPLDQIAWDSMDKSTWFFLLILPCWCLCYIQGGCSS